MTGGIVYKIINLKNNKIYCGQTRQPLKHRLDKHITAKDGYRPLTKAIKKYGIENFKIEIIDWANNQTELNYREWIWIHKLNCISPNGYNLREGGRNGPISEYQKKRISESNKNRVYPPEFGQKISAAKKGKKRIYIPTKEYLQKLKENTTKQWQNPEIRKIMTQKLKKSIQESCGRKVVDISNGKIYNTIVEAAKDIGVTDIGKSLSNKARTVAGTIFKYIEDWDGKIISKEEIKRIEIERRQNNKLIRSVIHLETNRLFDSIADVAKFFDLNARSINKAISYKRKYKGHSFVYFDKWDGNPPREPQKGQKIVDIFTGDIYRSVGDVSSKLNLKITTINQGIFHDRPVFKKYQFKYLKDWDGKVAKPNIKDTRIINLSTGKVYKSAIEAGKSENMCGSHVLWAIKNNKLAKGIRFDFYRNHITP